MSNPESAGTQAGYTGPIEVGDTFIWEPNTPHAWVRVRVTRIDAVPNDERRIWTVVVTGNSVNRTGDEAWNDESRFREACIKDEASRT